MKHVSFLAQWTELVSWKSKQTRPGEDAGNEAEGEDKDTWGQGRRAGRENDCFWCSSRTIELKTVHKRELQVNQSDLWRGRRQGWHSTSQPTLRHVSMQEHTHIHSNDPQLISQLIHTATAHLESKQVYSKTTSRDKVCQMMTWNACKALPKSTLQVSGQRVCFLVDSWLANPL